MELPDFDKLLEMAQQRPEELEALREALVEEVITSARSGCQRRLRGLQFQIDMTRRKAKTPMAACIKISELMYKSLADLRMQLNDPWQHEAQKEPETEAADVLSMDEYKSRNQVAGMA